MKFIAWTVLCFIAATDAAGRFCRERLNEILALVRLNFHITPPTDSSTFFAQKGVHVLLYAMLGYFAASESDTLRRKIANITGASICILTEVFQYFTQTRHMSVYDMALNLAAFSIVAAWCMFSQRPRQKPNALPIIVELRTEEIGERSQDSAVL